MIFLFLFESERPIKYISVSLTETIHLSCSLSFRPAIKVGTTSAEAVGSMSTRARAAETRTEISSSQILEMTASKSLRFLGLLSWNGGVQVTDKVSSTGRPI